MLVTREQLIILLLLCFSAASIFCPEDAFARGDRVMGAANEGAVLRVQYIAKMERLDLERKQCRRDLEAIVNPQMLLLDELGLLGRPGPAKSIYEEAKLNAEGKRLLQLQVELTRLGNLINQSSHSRDDSVLLRNMRTFEQRMREYMKIQKRFDARAQTLEKRSENAVTRFAAFARTLIQIKKAGACQAMWQDLRSVLPLDVEKTLVRIRERTKTHVANLKLGQKNFSPRQLPDLPNVAIR